ncbi:translation initiation factor IF-2 [Dyadobacter sediminis]|uniref:Translation initiation factor IF-2 n=1 Tax=Dyadobacter sediminis TaxID=1493691 RepID=A0A5R9KFB5_9BACT|nr:translation initiation factor IF-2 [Dyadobacter sediminis]TLU94767.1 translation initiation factor IF-2 [Dyadobacter sediminis]GGB88336.1 translation initiation factor IF-2 [Dyadobacter sediminis]
MAEDKMMRLSQVARILNVGITTIVDHLSAKGYKVESNPNTKINSDQIEFLAKDFKSDDLKSSLSFKPAPVEAPAEVKEDKVKSDVDGILYFRNTTSKESEEKPFAEEKAPAQPAFENRLPGIKVVGKIDLNAKRSAPAPQPEPVPQPAAAEEPKKAEDIKPEVVKAVIPEPVIENKEVAPALVEQKEEVKAEPAAPVEQKIPEPKTEPVIEKAPEPKAEESKVTLPGIQPAVVEESVPVLPAVSTPEPVIAAAEPAPVAEAPAAIKEEPKTAAATETPVVNEVPAEGELIEARGEQLRGLRVVGKIELPADKAKKKDPVASSSDTAADKKRRRKRKRIRDGATVGGENRPATPAAAAGTPEANANTASRPKEANVPPASNRSGNRTNTNNTNAGTATTPPASGNTGNAAPKTGTNRPAGGGNNNSNNNRRGGKREEVSDKEVSDNIKATMARMGGGNTKNTARGKGPRRRDRADQNDPNGLGSEETKVLRVTEFVSANDLASLMDVTVQEVISVCMSMGMFVSINQRLDAEAITFIADEFGFEVAFISAEEEVQNDVQEEVDDEESLQERAPIVTIMGHVDHGKTSLLDYIRQENVASGEAGGITQHIGAYSVKTKTGKQVTFLDTPGHEAFTAMRARGAKVTDVVIIVIAADDSVMPQTREAINHAQVAGVPIVFAFSKVDKPGANTEKIREELANMNLLVEEWGGKYQTQEISSKSGMGIDELLEKVLLEAELLELKANPNRRAIGTVVEASLDKGRGYVTTILVQTGTLKVGDVVLAGAHFGKVKAMTDYLGRRLKTAGPSMPVQLLGLSGAPQAGDRFNVFENERDARDIATKREQIQREQSIRTRKHITLEEIGRRKAIGSFRELNLIVKGDVDGSVEALSDSLLQLSTSEVQVNIIHKAVGQISESDVNLAIASDAIIVGFQVRPSSNAKKMAEQDQIEIRHYSVIYNAIEEIKDAMTGMLAPTIEEIITGNIEIREVFKISRIGTIAGCYVTDGYVKRNNKIRVIRDGIVLFTGEIDSLKRYKDDVQEVRNGYECGLSIKNYNDIEVGDIIESFELREVKRTL